MHGDKVSELLAMSTDLICTTPTTLSAKRVLRRIGPLTLQLLRLVIRVFDVRHDGCSSGQQFVCVRIFVVRYDCGSLASDW
jgi:hypothetical protein